MSYIHTLLTIIFILAAGYGKGHADAKLDKETKLENPIKSREESYTSGGVFETISANKSSEESISHTRHRRYYGFPRNEVILHISDTKVYGGDVVALHVTTHCSDHSSMYECGGRVPTMHFYQDDVKIATLYIGFADRKCHLTHPNGTEHECAKNDCTCFTPDSNIYIFNYFFKATQDQNGATFIAVSGHNLTSNKVHLYVSVGGAVFTRWGNDSCGSIHNDKIFSGYSNYLFHNNSPLSRVCFPETNKALGLPIVGRKRKRSVRSQNAIVSPNTDPCAVCRSRRAISVLMVPGRSTCYGDMNIEYNGYLIPGGNDVLCLDAARVAKISTTRFVNVMKTECLDNGHCGTSLNVGPIECVVCSK